MIRLSVGIPSYNESTTLRQIIDAVAAQRSLVREIIVVDNGSTDGTALLLTDIQKSWAHPEIHLNCSRLATNQGKGGAVQKAIEQAREPYFLIQDADLELNPANYPALVHPLEQDPVLAVVGDRYANGIPQNVKRISVIGNWIVTTLANFLFGLRVHDATCGYKLLPTTLAKELGLCSTGFDIEAEIIAKLAKKRIPIANAPVDYHPRSVAGGKKIHWYHGFELVLRLLRERFF